MEQCENCNLKKNLNGLYLHDDIVKVHETIEGKLNKVFIDHSTGLGMIKPLEDNNNAINQVKTNQMISADSVINNALKEAMTATTAACKKDKNAEEVEPSITKWEEAKRESERQNITNQKVVGMNEYEHIIWREYLVGKRSASLMTLTLFILLEEYLPRRHLPWCTPAPIQRSSLPDSRSHNSKTFR